MDLQHVNVRPEPGDAVLDRVEDVLPREPRAVDKRAVVLAGRRDRGLLALVVDAEEALGQQDHPVARDRVFGQRFAEDFLGAAVGVDVGLGVVRANVFTIVMNHCRYKCGEEGVPCPRC